MFVSVPLGLAALYWVRLFLPLLSADLPQSPTNRGLDGPGLRQRRVPRARSGCAPNDLRVGTRYHDRLGGIDAFMP